MQYSHTPYHFGYGNPVYWADPSGLVSRSFLVSLWNNSSSKSTTWYNYGGMFVTGSSSSSTGFKGVDEADNMFFDNLMKPVTVKYGRSSDGILMQDHVYQYGKFYDQLRSDRSSAKWDDFQSTLDGIGMIPVLGEIADGGNAIVSAFRGDYTGAGLSLLAMVPIAGNLATATKIGRRVDNVATTAFREFSGTANAIGKGVPNSSYEYLAPNGNPISKYFYNDAGKVEFQIDFKKHGVFEPGHGHNMSIPGSLQSGHLNGHHVPFMLVPQKYW